MKVLRDMVLQETPHTLARPRRGAPVRPAPEVPPAPAQPSRFEEGFAQGYAKALADAQQQLAADRAQADAERERLRRAAAEEGREAGLRAAGERAAVELEQLRGQLRQEASDAVAAEAQKLRQLAESLARARGELVAQAEDDLIALAHDVICRTLGNRAAAVETITDLVKLLLAQRERSGKVRVHLHPMDAEAVRDIQVAGWVWHADENVALGGVLLRSSEGDLDARLDVQLTELRRTLMRVRRERRALQDAEVRS